MVKILSNLHESIPLMNADHIFVVKSDPNAKDAALVKKTESEWTSSKEWKNLDAVKTTKYLMI